VHYIEHELASFGFVNNHLLKASESGNEAILQLYFDKQVVSNDNKRQEAVSNVVSKLNELSGVEVVCDELTGKPRTYTSKFKGNMGNMASIKLKIG
jgi:hypothetical protein